jgi:wyosine [tRNA(Phe)-imidazoG37] synthetase (radical SAM superfamily)
MHLTMKRDAIQCVAAKSHPVEMRCKSSIQNEVPLRQIHSMSGILFDEIIFGPVKSRRFGVSLGINLLPLDLKLCSYDCIYCECGLTGHEKAKKPELYKKEQILTALENRFKGLKGSHLQPDSITFAGNGEPTLHPDFGLIMDGVIELRNAFFPEAKVTVLSNATMLNRYHVREALLKADNNVLKLDAGTDEVFQVINRPLSHITINEIVDRLVEFQGDLTIQTLFLRGNVNGVAIDNTIDAEVEAWLGHLKRIDPKLVMLYPIDRLTPFATLEKISPSELENIAQKVEAIGLKAEVFS